MTQVEKRYISPLEEDIDPTLPPWMRELIMRKRALKAVEYAAAVRYSSSGDAGSQATDLSHIGVSAVTSARGGWHPTVNRSTTGMNSLGPRPGAGEGGWRRRESESESECPLQPVSVQLPHSEQGSAVSARLDPSMRLVEHSRSNGASDGMSWKRSNGYGDIGYNRVHEVNGKPAVKGSKPSVQRVHGAVLARRAVPAMIHKNGIDQAPRDESDSGSELEYGPGIVKKLKSKFINLTLKQQREIRRPPLRRVASLEHLVEDDNAKYDDVFMAQPSEDSNDNNQKRKEILKKARSMEVLSFDHEIHRFQPSEGFTLDNKDHKKTHDPSEALANDNIVIVESKPADKDIDLKSHGTSGSRPSSVSSVAERELPPPDTVKLIKKIYEPFSPKPNARPYPPVPVTTTKTGSEKPRPPTSEEKPQKLSIDRPNKGAPPTKPPVGQRPTVPPPAKPDPPQKTAAVLRKAKPNRPVNGETKKVPNGGTCDSPELLRSDSESEIEIGFKRIPIDDVDDSRHGGPSLNFNFKPKDPSQAPNDKDIVLPHLPVQKMGPPKQVGVIKPIKKREEKNNLKNAQLSGQLSPSKGDAMKKVPKPPSPVISNSTVNMPEARNNFPKNEPTSPPPLPAKLGTGGEGDGKGKTRKPKPPSPTPSPPPLAAKKPEPTKDRDDNAIRLAEEPAKEPVKMTSFKTLSKDVNHAPPVVNDSVEKEPSRVSPPPVAPSAKGAGTSAVAHGGMGLRDNWHQQSQNTMQFNFSDRKFVPDYVEYDGMDLSKKRSRGFGAGGSGPGVILLTGDINGETSDGGLDEDALIAQLTARPPSPCLVVFENGDVVINGKSSLKTHVPNRPKLKLAFNDDATTTFEYPSEQSMLEDHDALDSSAISGRSGEAGLGLGKSSALHGGLASYTPSKIQIGTAFELGVSRTTPTSSSGANKSGKKEPEPPVEDFLKETPTGEAYSQAGTTSDLLF